MELKFNSKNLNDLCFSFYTFYKNRIKHLITNDTVALEDADRYCGLYLKQLHRSAPKIIKRLDQKHWCSIRKQYPDIFFEFRIEEDRTSSFKIKVSKTLSVKHDARFLDDKLKLSNGYVYFIKSDFGYKIGYTATLKKRMKVFEVKLPFKFEIHSVIQCPEYKHIEFFLHNQLHHKRINGEWFDLNDKDFVDIDILMKNMGYERNLYKEEMLNGTN